MSRRFDVERIKADNPIENVVARYVELKRRGRVLVGLCPFHQERDPSFTVWPGDGGWYCFGCGKGGDVIDFVMKIENVDFKEACEILGGHKLPDLKAPPPKVPPARAVEHLGRAERQALGLALRVYHARLWSLPPDAPPRRYLAQRKITPEAIRRFGIGWCDGQDLLPAAKFLRANQEAFINTGLLGGQGDCEFLRGRIVIPDRGPDGSVIHMVGRALGHQEPRYLSLPGVPKPIYGLSGIRRQQPVAVVEGIFCRISLEIHGIQAVAIMGTALRGQRAEALKAVPALYFIPDNDPSGKRAVAEWREAIGHGTVVELPAGVKDVNDLDQAGGLEDWLKTWAKWRQ